MDKLFLLVMLQFGTLVCPHGNTTQALLFDEWESISYMINELCPRADICDLNATDAVLRPNGVVSRGRISCCQGCSCHTDCKDRQNCCYPGDYDTIDDEVPESTRSECLYTRLGQPEYLNAFVPSFKTIVAPPAGGCVDNRPIKLTKNVILQPTCDDVDVTPFGSYFPVYSKEADQIYKNILCARCHGVLDVESFKPLLVCKKINVKTRKLSTLAENLNFLQTRALSPSCYVDFKYSNFSVLKKSRCFKEIINNCTSDKISPPIHQRSFSSDFDVVQSLCESDLNSPTVNAIDGKVYKNVFCSLCGKASMGFVQLFCFDLYQTRITGESLTFVLDPTLMHTIDKAVIPKARSEICLNQQGNTKTCRQIFCATGRVRNSNDECEMVISFYGTNGVQIHTQLIPHGQIDFDRNNFEVESQHLVETILKSNFWPKHWEIAAIYIREDSTVCEEKAIAIITLAIKGKNTELIYRELANVSKNYLKITWRNKTHVLEQSILEYKISRELVKDSKNYLPSWQIYQTSIGPKENIFKCGTIKWNLAHSKFGIDNTMPLLNKLCLCNQIQLQQDEIILGPENTYLQSNLTRRALHDDEFELTEDVDGLNARVCVEDTIFAEQNTSRAGSLPSQVKALLMSVYLVYIKTL